MAQNEIEVAANQQGQPPVHKWTVMIYLADDNNLSANSIAIMQELEAAVHDDDVQVLACFDSNTPRPKGSRYLEIHRRRGQDEDTGMAWELHNDLVVPDERDHETFAPDFCNPDLSAVHAVQEPVAAEGLARFLNWAMKKHRGEKQMLILFGHGTAVAGQTFLIDDNPPSFLRLEELGRILGEHFGGAAHNRLDILACNNCVMNGIETAYELKDQVEFMIGSQGLMLALGWPYRKIIEAVVKGKDEFADIVALELLKVCARNLLDFSLMDRSLEQAVCDLTKFGEDGNIIANVKGLATVLQKALETDGEGKLLHPQACDAVRLARLQAQSFWDETFVDLYDFCELLLEQGREAVRQQKLLLTGLELGDQKDSALAQFDSLPEVKLFEEIGKSCLAVLSDMGEAVPEAYYIGSELQYSHGLSIYFPWTLPEETFFHEPVLVEGEQRGAAKFYELKTMFDIYKKYRFAETDVSGWADFLVSFFKATLRNVRRFDNKYDRNDNPMTLDSISMTNDENAFPVTLQKSSSDTGKVGDCTCPKIKNYPRRNYLSPADCVNKTDGMSIAQRKGQFSKGKEVSYLGWNVRGLVAKVIMPKNGDNGGPMGNAPKSSAPAPDETTGGAKTEPPS